MNVDKYVAAITEAAVRGDELIGRLAYLLEFERADGSTYLLDPDTNIRQESKPPSRPCRRPAQ